MVNDPSKGSLLQPFWSRRTLMAIASPMGKRVCIIGAPMYGGVIAALGRPRKDAELRCLIGEMTRANPVGAHRESMESC